MQSLLAGRLPFRVVVMIVVDMESIGLMTPSIRIMSILPSSAGASSLERAAERPRSVLVSPAPFTRP